MEIKVYEGRQKLCELERNFLGLQKFFVKGEKEKEKRNSWKQTGSWQNFNTLKDADAFMNFATQALIIGFLNLGVLWYGFCKGRAINRGEACGKKYTRIMIPSFVFILFADIFFVILSVF